MQSDDIRRLPGYGTGIPGRVAQDGASRPAPFRGTPVHDPQQRLLTVDRALPGRDAEALDGAHADVGEVRIADDLERVVDPLGELGELDELRRTFRPSFSYGPRKRVQGL